MFGISKNWSPDLCGAVGVAVDRDGNYKVRRVHNAFDCGFCVAITFKDGRVQQGNFDDFQISRIDESRLEVRTHIVKHSIDVQPSGAGEPCLSPFPLALCNAMFAATGKRIRELLIGQQIKI